MSAFGVGFERNVELEDDVTVLSLGIVCLSLCVPAAMTREQIEAFANRNRPTGIESRWAISEDKLFATGQTNPCDCERGPSHQHYLLNC